MRMLSLKLGARPAATALVCLAIAAAVLTMAVVTTAIGQGGQEPPEKQAVLAAEQARQAAAEKAPHAPKHPEITPVPSCPVDVAKVQTGIIPFRFGPFSGGRNLVNVASAVSRNGVPFIIYAGALDDDQQQGVLLVREEETDPCAVAAELVPIPQLYQYLTPVRTGALTLAQVEGDTVVFTTPGGVTGAFNYVVGSFVEQSEVW